MIIGIDVENLSPEYIDALIRIINGYGFKFKQDKSCKNNYTMVINISSKAVVKSHLQVGEWWYARQYYGSYGINQRELFKHNDSLKPKEEKKYFDYIVSELNNYRMYLEDYFESKRIIELI